jgi:predicted nicotinamide N-methyase
VRDWAAFIRANTRLVAPPLVPEITLHLADEVTPLWQATETFLELEGLAPPYWAFAWPGGQALARHLLDHPEMAHGRTVLDFAAGSGLRHSQLRAAAPAAPAPATSTRPPASR